VVLKNTFGFYYGSRSKLLPGSSVLKVRKLWLTSCRVLKLLQYLWRSFASANFAKNLPQMQNADSCCSKILP
jgi:hypothetical protein